MRGVVGMAVGVLVVAAAAGAAWRFGDATTSASTHTGGIAESARGATPTTLAAKAVEAVDPLAQVNVDPSSLPATAPTSGHESSGLPKSRASDEPRAAGATAPGAASARTGVTGMSPSAAIRTAPLAAEAASAAIVGETPLAHLRILASPMANVEIDGKPRGAAPIADIALPPGTHFVRLDCAALGEAVAQNVPFGPGESVTISGDFTGAHGRILVRRAGTNP